MNDTVRIASVTGVEVALKVAGPGARSYAFVIDWHFRLLLALAWLMVGMVAATGSLSWTGSGDALYQTFVFAVLLPSGAIYFLYHPLVEVIMQGRTPGKRIAGVRIVMEDGSMPGTTALLIRNALRLLDSLPMFYMVGLAATMVSRNSVRIGDLAAGTLLVYEHTGTGTTAYSLARNREAIARHGLDRAELARELLDRWHELAPEARASLARRLLTDLGEPGSLSVGELELMDRLRAHLG